jgi:hypothetical protein
MAFLHAVVVLIHKLQIGTTVTSPGKSKCLVVLTALNAISLISTDISTANFHPSHNRV